MKHPQAIAAVERGLQEAKSPADVSSLLETFYWLYPPENAERLFTSFKRAEQGITTPSSIDDLMWEIVIGKEPLDHLLKKS